jgi:hypothetical protein
MMRIAMVLAAGMLVSAAAAAEGPPATGTPLALLVHERVQKEVKLSDEQVAAVKKLHERVRTEPSTAPEAYRTLEKTLAPEQSRRLKEISYQVRGGAAVGDPAVAKALGLSAKQKSEVRDIWVNEEKTLGMLLKVARFRTKEIRAGFIRSHRKKAGERMLATLTEAQQKQFEKLKGKPFDTAGLDAEP